MRVRVRIRVRVRVRVRIRVRVRVRVGTRVSVSTGTPFRSQHCTTSSLARVSARLAVSITTWLGSGSGSG